MAPCYRQDEVQGPWHGILGPSKATPSYLSGMISHPLSPTFDAQPDGFTVYFPNVGSSLSLFPETGMELARRITPGER